jgi:hypothetical protein
MSARHRVRWLSIEAGQSRKRIGRVWIPHDLHVWGGRRGVHLWLFDRPHVRFDSLNRDWRPE